MKTKKIQKIKTPDGHMIPIFREWDEEVNEGHRPKMVYATTIEPGVTKDVIFHEKRTSYLTCIHGKVILECLEENQISSVVLDSNETDFINLVIIPKSAPIRMINQEDKMAILINCPDPSWHPQDPDTIKFKSWKEFEEWKGV